MSYSHPQFYRRYSFKSRLLDWWKSAEKIDSCQKFDVTNPGCVLQQIIRGGLSLNVIQNVKQRTVFSLAAGIRPKIQKSDTRVNLELIPGFCDFRYHLIVMLRKGRGGGGERRVS